jgi:phosphoglycolate phosphatase
VGAAEGRIGRAALVGDSLTDSAAARAAGIPMVLVPFGYRDIALEDIPADVRIASFSELPPAIETLFPAR